jgi:hypothetical protein
MTDEDKRKKQPLARVLLAITVLLGASILLEIAGFLMTSADAEIAVARVLGSNGADPNDLEPGLAAARSLADDLKQKNLFVTKPPPQHPVNEVAGILGGEALINDKWYKAGDSVGDARIVAVEPTRVKIIWDGKEKEFAPLAASGSEGPVGPPSRGRPAGPPRRPSGPRPTMGPPRPSRSMRGRPQGGPLLSPQERADLRERWQTMTPEEQARFREEMRERFRRRSR